MVTGKSIGAAGLLLSLAGCFVGPLATVAQLRARATFDLQCPDPKLEVHDIDERTKGVRGCGKQLAYVEICDNRPDGWHCTWVVNSPAWQQGPPRSRHTPRPAQAWWWSEPRPAPEPGAAPPPGWQPPPAPTAPVPGPAPGPPPPSGAPPAGTSAPQPPPAPPAAPGSGRGTAPVRPEPLPGSPPPAVPLPVDQR